MSLMACNALDYLVALAMELDIDAREDGVYLKDGTRWQPTVDWSQIGPVIGKLNLGFDHVGDRYQPIMAKRGNGGGLCGETHQVAVCNFVVMYSMQVSHDTPNPYPLVRAIDLRIRDENFIKKYPYLNIDDIERIERINQVGVATYLKESSESHKRWVAAVGDSFSGYCIDRAPRLIKTVITNYPELISVEAHAMGV